MEISRQAKSALLAAGEHDGFTVHGRFLPVEELKAAGFMGGGFRLNDRGISERSRIARQLEDEAFGE